ncbi:N-acetyl sugar amidotransferase [Desulfonatronum thiodismutans]|uniref:N-acetyl sugar amidotransferase n=1 Tax=Desulfonatronum thiodismutans TaxID=159290 RepID=UPI0004ABE447|nr:N-acetyl sugar amidotransferase [Desulfonatronum thiodismutans]
MIRYCTSCLFPETKPDLELDKDGVCSACIYYARRKEVDWDARKEELVAILERYCCQDGSRYDCIVPSSGGKDSHFQVTKMLELGMNPLVVTSTTCAPSDIGKRNIDNLKDLGVDYVEFSYNRPVRRRLNRFALEQIGDISWPEHVTIFTVPVHYAVKFNVPLIIWGENSQNEYGGPAGAAENNALNRRWLEEFGGLLGLRVTDLIGQEGIEQKHLIMYTYPNDLDLQRTGVTGLFLGYFVPWDGLQNALVAQSRGFETWPGFVEGTIANYENLDNHQTGIHDYFKYLKYGFGRATDLANLHIRRGRLRREDALEMVKIHDGRFPWTYLGKPIEVTLTEIGLTLDAFIAICDRYTNKRIFKTDAKGKLVKDNGRPVKINHDNP